MARFSSSVPLPLFIAQTALRALQFIFAVTVLGLYGQAIHSARNAHEKPGSKTVYAEVVGGLSALTALVFLIPVVGAWSAGLLAGGWDAVLL